MANNEDKIFDIKKFIHNIGHYEVINKFINNDYTYPNDEITQIKHSLNKINKGNINDKEKAYDEFKKLKEKLNNKVLSHRVLKDLKLAIFGHNYEESKYEECIAERVKIRKQTIGTGLKRLTPQQMLARLPISLAQLYAGNNSQKLKNEIRQLLYSLYRSKQFIKT